MCVILLSVCIFYAVLCELYITTLLIELVTVMFMFLATTVPLRYSLLSDLQWLVLSASSFFIMYPFEFLTVD